jgi:hypothetical protein
MAGESTGVPFKQHAQAMCTGDICSGHAQLQKLYIRQSACTSWSIASGVPRRNNAGPIGWPLAPAVQRAHWCGDIVASPRSSTCKQPSGIARWAAVDVTQPTVPNVFVSQGHEASTDPIPLKFFFPNMGCCRLRQTRAAIRISLLCARVVCFASQITAPSC